MRIEELVIEVTRRCNMACEHCLRGAAQNIDLKEEYLESLFSRIESVGTIIITGGEPSLVPGKINAIVDIAKKHGVTFDNFYMVTNAKRVTPEFITAVFCLYMYCQDNEYSQLAYSNDTYHDEVKAENIKSLEVFRFTSPKWDNPDISQGLINEGRAKQNGMGRRDGKQYMPDLESAIYTEYETVTNEAQLYLNCKGNLIFGCDLSYRSQSYKRNVICSVEDLTMDKLVSFFSR